MLRRVFAEASVPQPDKNARVLARYLLKERPSSINARQLRLTKKADLPGIRDAKAMDEACSALCDTNWLRPDFSRQGNTTGRKAKNFDVNPRLADFCIGPPPASSGSADSPPNGTSGANGGAPYTNNFTPKKLAP